MIERITVPFAGEGAGVDELSWGQREIWSAMRRQNWWLPIGYAQPLPAGTTVDTVVDGLQYWMARYQTMRTRLRHDPDGHTRQVVHATGEVTLEIVDADDHDDPAKVAEETRLRYWHTDYDFVDEWPVRMAVIRHRGTLTHQVVVLCHLVTDGLGAVVMMDELTTRPPSPATAPHPLEQIRWQRSPAGRRQCEAALRHWEALLRAIPARRFPGPGAGQQGSEQPQSPRHWHGEFNSPATHLALRAIAAHTKVAASPLFLAVFAIAFARVTGANPVAVQVVVSNRFRPGLGDTVSPVNQTGLCVVDLAGTTFEQAVIRTAQRALGAFKYAYYDPYQVDALVERVSRERGEEVDIACYFNDRRVIGTDPPDGPVPTAEQIRAALPRTTFGWTLRQDDPWERLFVHIENVADTAAITVQGDTHHISPSDMEACVREMETVAVEAAVELGGGR
ncbi:condensation domain-containing protein [Phytohabitans aurantiacus]|uniref:Condensation domain-containing protein n=1 Tax=Phytohabitans aurantiacus TaxID=3016789 RepID=A0ABQ5RAJ5_9ACTN|nr:condensation domain-containing protein [Phytohabitans aurantiacus]GLI03418.1 hypothetical protein Pa4123_86960 [Phytohabitans aurantiacus]